MKLRVGKGTATGKVRAPPSKSYTHRATICSAMADGTSKVMEPLRSDDTEVTAKVCSMLGADIRWDEYMEIEGKGGFRTPEDILDCHGSGTSIRLLTALAAHAPGISVLTGNDSLRKRPMGELLDAIHTLGARCHSTRKNGLPPVVVFGGGIRGGKVSMRGDVSSQYITALLMTCPWAERETVIELTTELESKPYVEITLEVLEDFGVKVDVSHEMGVFTVEPDQTFAPGEYTVPGDFSSAAFLLAMGTLSGSVEVTGLNHRSKQGDRKIVDVLKQMGGTVKVGKDSVYVEQSELEGITLDVSDIPDLTPICTVLATQARGTTQLVNAGRLRIKESDRLSAITTELRKMGADIIEGRDSLTVKGPTELKGAEIYPHDDHRIAMSCAVAASVATGDTVIEDGECINKSYPRFIEDLRKIGADLECLLR